MVSIQIGVQPCLRLDLPVCVEKTSVCNCTAGWKKEIFQRDEKWIERNLLPICIDLGIKSTIHDILSLDTDFVIDITATYTPLFLHSLMRLEYFAEYLTSSDPRNTRRSPIPCETVIETRLRRIRTAMQPIKMVYYGY